MTGSSHISGLLYKKDNSDSVISGHSFYQISLNINEDALTHED